jgi:putative membrane protein
VPAADSPPSPEPVAYDPARRVSLLFRAPSPPVAIGLILLVSAPLAALLWAPPGTTFLEGFLLAFAGPALLAGVATTPVASLFGGRFEFHRGLFLALSALVLELPLAAAWKGAWVLWPGAVPSLVLLGPFLAGPAFWFRHLSLFGVSRSSHRRMIAASLLQPLLSLAGFFAISAPTARILLATLVFLVLGFVCAVAVLRAADRPIRREFHHSGVQLIRPLLDHVGSRDASATRALEQFFLRSPVFADVRVALLAFTRGGSVHATVALPTVHPGPFAALGASDLPRKLAELLGPSAGLVLVPHTPSDHDLDLPSEAEVARLGAVSRELLASLPGPGPSRASPLVSPYPGSFARAQWLGVAVLVVVSQAPAPTDDIAYAVADRIVRELTAEGTASVALIDAHNSYVEGQGDISYGSPAAEKLVADAKAAVAAARAAARDGPVEVGVAARGGYSIGNQGIGPQGLRALVIRAAGTTTGYLLIDGNNLVAGEREPIVADLLHSFDAAEVMTTDNHVVHEVDGGINPVGERYSREALRRDARAVLEAAKADLAPSEVRFASRPVGKLQVLGPGYTARLLTSLGDTLSMFTQMFPTTLLLLLTSSLAVALLLR